MRVIATQPEVPDSWAVVAACTFCNGVTSKFVLLTDIDNVAVMCSDCMVTIAQAFLDKYGPEEDS